MKKAIVATLIFLVLVTLPFIINAAGGKVGNPELKPNLENSVELAKRDGAKNCVENTEYMRANHMKILKDERANYVRHGEQNDKHSIKACFTCHDYQNFCAECHKYNGVEPGCLNQTGGCHSTEQPGFPRPKT